MKQNIRNTILAALCSLALSPFFAKADSDRKTEAETALQRFHDADSSLTALLAGSVGYAVFPNVGKGGLIFGAEHGKGVVYENGKAIGEATLTEVNVGPQVGGETFCEVIVFENSDALRHFKEGHFELSAKLNATAGAEGAALNANYRGGVVVFTLPRNGFMLQAAIGGQKFNFKPSPAAP